MRLDELRGKGIRAGRLGIQPSFPGGDLTDLIHIQFHTGHARTLLIGHLVCKELDIPLGTRFKWKPELLRSRVQSKNDIASTRYGVHAHCHSMMLCFCQMASCADFLGIGDIHFYVPPVWEDVPGPWIGKINRIVKEAMASGFTTRNWPADDRAAWYDDAVRGPLLFIRGSDWASPEWSLDVQEYVAMENLVIEAAGYEKLQITMPSVLVGASKMSTSNGTQVSWEVLKTLGREGAREFLLQGIDLNDLPGESTMWSYDELAEAKPCLRS